jgi:hypothetical protein
LVGSEPLSGGGELIKDAVLRNSPSGERMIKVGPEGSFGHVPARGLKKKLGKGRSVDC